MSARALVLIVLAACGRVGFDAVALVDATGTSGGPIAHLSFDDDPVDGVADITGRGHDGVCDPVCPAVVPGVDGMAYQFDGTMLVRVPYRPSLSPLGGVTVALWIRITAGQGCIAGKPVGMGTGNSWQLCSFPPGVTACSGPDGTSCSSVDPEPTTNAWFHLTLTHDGTRMRVWSRGALQIDVEAPMAADASDIVIGGDIDAGAPVGRIAAVIDEVRLWDRALVEDEVAALLDPY